MVDYNGNIDARLTEVSQKGATDRAEKGIPLLVASEEPISSDDLAATYVDMDLEITWMGRLLNATRVKLSFCLERSHYAILLRLEKCGPQAIGDIAHGLLLDNSTATRQISAMEEDGLLKRELDRDDQRRAIIHIKPKGVRMLAAMRNQRISALETLVGDWSHEDRRRLVELLDRYNKAVVDRIHLLVLKK